MGGGASSMQGMEDLLATTYMIGKAIAAITFPGMYRIYDFHSPKAPRLKAQRNNYSFFAPDSDEEDDDDYQEPSASDYEHFFKVVVGGDVIYIENPLIVNEAGWSPLHACCMSFLTKDAGLQLVDEIVAKGGNLNIPTLAGPGTFNKGWTPLHMACAYGVEPLVDKLIKAGAKVNTVNSYGYTPLLEACHRGFINVVSMLIKGGADINYAPPEEQAAASPFIGAPPQTALGETARSGFQRIVQMLIEAGADKDRRNHLGWTPLHEACFYNRIETVKTLLLSGANATLRTHAGALPHHLAGLQVVRTMIQEMGGPSAVPEPGDQIDMISVLKELTMAETAIVSDAEGNVGIIRLDSGGTRSSNSSVHAIEDDSSITTTGSHVSNNKPKTHRKHGPSSRKHTPVDAHDEGDEYDDDIEDKDAKGHHQEQSQLQSPQPLLHSGEMLGQLPSLSGHRLSPSKHMSSEVDSLINTNARSPGSLGGSQPQSQSQSQQQNSADSPLSKRADSKKPGKKKKNKHQEEVPRDMPEHFLCQLTRRPMSEPVKSTFGNVFEKTAIMNWFSQQGRICPLTGAPLSEINLKPMEELGNEIREWVLRKSMKQQQEQQEPQLPQHTTGATVDAESGRQEKGISSAAGTEAGAKDDLYDF